MPTLREHDRCNPRCTRRDVYIAWRRSSAGARVLPSDPGFCVDCLPWYQDKMCSAGKCDHPEVLFYTEKDGSVVGSNMIRSDKLAEKA